MTDHLSVHSSQETHHHHSHATASQHVGGHHLLQIEHLSVGFSMYDPHAPYLRAARVRTEVIRDLSISVHAGEVVAVVGASGSGKTILADTIMGLFEHNVHASGAVHFDGEQCSASGLAALRGHGISLVPQGVSHLDPLMKVGPQVEGLTCRKMRQGRRKRRQELFERYELAEEVAQLYPHELSGGMARRVLLCCALMDDPKLIIADEPTPGLDLALAVKALEDLRAFADDGGGVMLITHDIELACAVADRIAVFKDGTVLEETAVESFSSPELLAHPYSRALWKAMPEHGFALGSEAGEDRC